MYKIIRVYKGLVVNLRAKGKHKTRIVLPDGEEIYVLNEELSEIPPEPLLEPELPPLTIQKEFPATPLEVKSVPKSRLPLFLEPKVKKHKEASSIHFKDLKRE